MTNSPLGTVLNRLRTLLEPEDADATDRELLRRFVARREEAAFGELVRRHGPMILGVCRRILGDAHAAEDAFQATFLVLVRRARAVPWRESLGGWLHGTARRVALRARRAAGVSRLIAAGSAGSRRPLADPDPSEEAAARELRRVLDQELQGLPAKYRAPLVLCDLEGKTHEQAARELGWPKGSLAKRLNGGRERLRARLVRRGVVPAAETNELAPAPPAALTAAAMLSAHGGASTKATALAKGVIQAMWTTKIVTAAVLTTALVVTGTLAGVGTYRAWGARAAAPASPLVAAPAPAEAPPAEDKDTMPIDKAVVYHVTWGQGEAAFKALTEGAVIATNRPEDVKGDVQLYLAGFEKTTRQSRPVPIGPRLAILAVGPMLNSGDEAAAVALIRHGDRLELEMAYTSGEAEGKDYSKNIVWRPLVQVPVDLAVGRYQLRVTWQARKSLPAGEAWPGRTDISVRDFAVVGDDRQESKAVRLNGAEFRAFAEGQVRAPAAGKERPVDLGLRITNVSDKPLIFYNVAPLKVTTPDGKELKGTFAPAIYGRLSPQAIAVDPGKDMLPPFDASLQWTPDGKNLQLQILDYSGNLRSYDDIKPGKYLLTAEDDVEQSPDPTRPFWTGRVKTEPVAFEILDAANVSKPVRVDGLEFTAQAPARVTAPAPGGKAGVDIEMRVVNVSKNRLLLTTFDVIRPRLITPDGKEIEPELRGRKDTPKVTPLANLAPGDSWTWRPEASLQWTTDRATLKLTGPDGRGVAGEWSFSMLHPGTYRLVVEYANKTMELTETPNWVGTAATEPVEFEIVAP